MDCEGDCTAQETRGAEIEVVGMPWSARPSWRERWREERGRERSHMIEKYCGGDGVALHMDVWVDSGRAHLLLEV